jgi:hypothetical protein
VPTLKWVAADEEGLVKFLVGEKSFNEDRIRKAVQRINAAKSKSTQGTPPVVLVPAPSLIHSEPASEHSLTLQGVWRAFSELSP